MDALLIIDMQVACIEQVPRHNINSTIETINKLSFAFRQRNLPVIHIQHEEESGEFLRGSNPNISPYRSAIQRHSER